MPEQALVEPLIRELERYRSWTEKLLVNVPDEWVYRRVDWTECSIGWHLGHLAWKQDSYAALYFDAAAQLEEGWQRRFYGPDPLDPADAPPVDDLLAGFRSTFERYLERLSALSDADITRASAGWPEPSLLAGITNVIFHEGEHYAGIDALRWSFANDRD